MIHWLETNRIHEPKSTTIRSGFAGRSDFTKFSFRRYGGYKHDIHRVVNIISHLGAISATSAFSQVREVVFPFPNKSLSISINVDAVSGQTLSVPTPLIHVAFLDTDGNTISDYNISRGASGRTDATLTTPSNMYKVRLTIPATNGTFTMSELSMRADGSHEYINE